MVFMDLLKANEWPANQPNKWFKILMSDKNLESFIEWAKNNKVREVHFEPSVNGGSVDKYDALAKRLGMKKEPNYRIIL